MTVFYSKSWNICSAKFGWNLCLFKSTYMNCIDPEGKKKILSKLTDIPVYNWVDVHMVSKIVSNKTICYNKACSIACLRLDRSIYRTCSTITHLHNEPVTRSHDWSCPCFTRLKTRAFVISHPIYCHVKCIMHELPVASQHVVFCSEVVFGERRPKEKRLRDMHIIWRLNNQQTCWM